MMRENVSEWDKKDEKYVWHPFAVLESENIYLSHGEGAYLYTTDGRKIFDGISSWWVNLHGHANPFLVKALKTQAETLEQVIFSGFAHAPGAILAEELIKETEHHFEKVFYSDNGSTSVEVALKIALQYFFNQDEPQRKTFIAFEGAYHGDTFGAMSVGARGIFNQPFESLFFDVKFIPLPCENNFEKALSLFETYCETGEVAGFIFEPLVQGSAGMRMYRAEYLDELIKTAKKHGVLCIADEVMTGFGRTGKYFACQYLSEKVDVMCLSKGITGGFMPFGATLIHSKIVRVFRGETFARSFLHGHSYTGSPLACALAAESLRLLRSEAVQNDIQRISDSHAAFVKKIRNHRALADARSLGTVMAAEIKTEEKTGYFNSKRGDLSKFFMQRDILLRPLGNVIYILPPYCADETALHKTYDAVEELLEAL